MIMMSPLKLFILVVTVVLLIMMPSSSAHGINEEQIWVFQGSYELGIGDRAYPEGFTLRLHLIENKGTPAAKMLIYRNGVFREAFLVDDSVNSEHTYGGELKVDILSIDHDTVYMDIYKLRTELVWIRDIPRTSLKTGDILTGNDYRITFKEINENGALIKIDYNGEILEDVYDTNDHEKISDELMINILYINRETKELFIETLKPGSPAIEIMESGVKEAYCPGEPVEYEIVVRNTGTIPLHGLRLKTESGNGNVITPTQQHPVLEPGEEKVFLISIEPDMKPLGENLTVTSNVYGNDYTGNEYNNLIDVGINTRPYISIEKVIFAEKRDSYSPLSVAEQLFHISITIRNMANFQTAVTVIDELPPSFIPMDIENTEWGLVIDAGGSRTIEYIARPTEQGKFHITPAKVMWNDRGKTYSLESKADNEAFFVKGPEITIEKELSSSYVLAGEKTDITIFVRNQGDRHHDITVRDSLPAELAFAEGMNEWHGSIKVGEKKELRYALIADEAGQYHLPGAEITLKEKDGAEYTEVSNSLFLYVEELLAYEKDHTGNDNSVQDRDHLEGHDTSDLQDGNGFTSIRAAGFLVSSFVVIFLFVAIVPTFIYLYIKTQYK